MLPKSISTSRLKNNWTQEKLTEKLGTTSVYVSSLENAKKNIRIDYIISYC